MILNNDKVDLLLRYSGGKYYALKQLGKFWLEKKHKKYVEPFFGGGSVFWTKPKAKINWINDYDKDLVDFLKFIKNNDNLKKLLKKIDQEKTPSKERHQEVKNINIDNIRAYIQRLNNDDRNFLDSLNFQFADIKINDTIWFTEREVISSIDFINQRNKSNYIKVNRLFEVEDDQYLTFFIVKDLLKSGNIPPLSYLYDRIKTNIINQRKLNLIKSINKEVLEDALKSNKYEVFK